MTVTEEIKKVEGYGDCATRIGEKLRVTETALHTPERSSEVWKLHYTHQREVQGYEDCTKRTREVQGIGDHIAHTR